MRRRPASCGGYPRGQRMHCRQFHPLPGLRYRSVLPDTYWPEAREKGCRYWFSHSFLPRDRPCRVSRSAQAQRCPAIPVCSALRRVWPAQARGEYLSRLKTTGFPSGSSAAQHRLSRQAGGGLPQHLPKAAALLRLPSPVQTQPEQPASPEQPAIPA